MNAIGATVVDGKIIPDSPPKWEEGTRLRIRLADDPSFEELPDDDDLAPDTIVKDSR